MSHSPPHLPGDPHTRRTGEGMEIARAELPRAGGGASGTAASARVLRPSGRRTEGVVRPVPARRYRVREVGGVRVLSCTEAPTVAVRLERGRSVSESAARKAESGTIFLDGAAQGPPFLDPQRSVYNLDHHEGCVRPFTLSTCEQAMVLVRRIADLRRRDWTVWANDADLDTVLAIWVLLNHHRLNGEDSRPRETVMPLLRVETTIDVHGFGNLELAGLPPDALAATCSWMSALQERERAMRADRRWERMDPFAYVVDRLYAIDSHVYPPGAFDDLEEIEELVRVPIGAHSVAVACRSRVGIYETETQLRRLYAERLGLVILERGPGAYSLRQVDPELPADLDALYARLNLLDPAAGGERSENRWGGSADIGGSPRRSGSALSTEQIGAICRGTYRQPSRAERLAALARTSGLSATLVGGAALATWLGAPELPVLPGGPASLFTALLAVLAAACLLRGRSAPGLAGLRWPSGLAALALAPLALVGAGLGGVWMPRLELDGLAPPLAGALGLSAAVVLAASVELLFRGLVYGRLAWTLLARRGGGSGGGLAAALLSGALYAPWIALPWLAAPPPLVPLPPGFAPWAPLSGAFLFGCVAGLARRSSHSVLLPVLLHVMGTLAVGALALGWLPTRW